MVTFAGIEGLTPIPTTILSEGEAGRFLGLRPGALRRMRVLALGPPYILMEMEGGLAFSYVQEDLEAWALARRVGAKEGLGKLWGKQGESRS